MQTVMAKHFQPRLLQCAALLLSCCLGPVLQAQEHSYAPSDIDKGRGLYQANCLGCHGNNGDAVEGANLATGRFRRASSDEELIALIRSGIPNTLMIARPQLGYGDLRAMVAFLRSMQSGGALTASDTREVLIGDAGRGASLFFGKGVCDQCHGVNGGGSPLYQDLAGIGAQRSAASLEESLLQPQKEVRQGERFYQITNSSGQRIEGKLLNRDRHSIQLLTMDETLQSFSTQAVQEHGFTPSPMPAYLDVLSATEVSDIVAYLLTLKE